jgi:hypothetical protein
MTITLSLANGLNLTITSDAMTTTSWESLDAAMMAFGATVSGDADGSFFTINSANTTEFCAAAFDGDTESMKALCIF